MIEKVPSLEKLVHEFSKLPGIGSKTAQRLAYHILKSKGELAEDIREALYCVKTLVVECPRCFSYTEEATLCHYCSDTQRSEESLCVVEDPGDISRIDNSGAFRGRYHVLQGVIAPLEGIGPEHLRISELANRIESGISGDGPKIKEVIFALDADIEGDTTVLYLQKLLKDMGVTMSRIAHGVPIGGDIDYIDYRTLGRAIENRVSL